MLRPRLLASERPYAEALKRHFQETSRTALAFSEPAGASVFFPTKELADKFEQKLHQIEGEFLPEELVEEKVSKKGSVQDRRRRELVHHDVFYGASVDEKGEKPAVTYQGPFAVHLQFTNPRIGWHVWTALQNQRKPHPLVERILPIMEIFDEKRANLPEVHSIIESLRDCHVALLSTKQDILNHLRNRKGALALGALSKEAEELEKNQAAYDRNRLRHLAGTAATHLATAAILGLSVKTLGFLAALGYQWSLGALSIKKTLDFAHRETELMKRSMGPQHAAELELHKAFRPQGMLATTSHTTRHAIVNNVIGVLQAHASLHRQYIDYFDRLIGQMDAMDANIKQRKKSK